MYPVLDVSRYVINYSNDSGSGISNLKLQKILYFIQAYFLVATSKPCFSEKIEAWDFGPVVPVAYHEFKHFGSGNIPKIFSYVDIDPDHFWNSGLATYGDNCISEDDKKRIRAVVDRFSDYSAADLVKITHRQLPWQNAYVPYMNNEITQRAIEAYFHG